jgi:hypothetical protein
VAYSHYGASRNAPEHPQRNRFSHTTITATEDQHHPPRCTTICSSPILTQIISEVLLAQEQVRDQQVVHREGFAVGRRPGPGPEYHRLGVPSSTHPREDISPGPCRHSTAISAKTVNISRKMGPLPQATTSAIEVTKEGGGKGHTTKVLLLVVILSAFASPHYHPLQQRNSALWIVSQWRASTSAWLESASISKSIRPLSQFTLYHSGLPSAHDLINEWAASSLLTVAATTATAAAVTAKGSMSC